MNRRQSLDTVHFDDVHTVGLLCLFSRWRRCVHHFDIRLTISGSMISTNTHCRSEGSSVATICHTRTVIGCGKGIVYCCLDCALVFHTLKSPSGDHHRHPYRYLISILKRTGLILSAPIVLSLALLAKPHGGCVVEVAHHLPQVSRQEGRNLQHCWL